MQFIIGALMIVGAVVFMLTALALLNAFVIQYLWLWFVVPTFGLAALTFVQAIGFGIIVGYLTHQHTPKFKNQTPDTNNDLMMIYLRPFMVLGIAWIVQLFM